MVNYVKFERIIFAFIAASYSLCATVLSSSEVGPVNEDDLIFEDFARLRLKGHEGDEYDV